MPVLSTNINMQNKYESGEDKVKLRKILGQFATGVAIATTLDENGNPFGLTINSLTSVSLEPPLLLFCVAKTSSTLEKFKAQKYFGINILDGLQKEISKKFASFGIDKFHDIEWQKGQLQMPIFPNNIATIECEKTAIHDGGDHLIFIGEIKHATGHESHDPLIYHNGHYKKIHI